jgi:hypothetical protein
MNNWFWRKSCKGLNRPCFHFFVFESSVRGSCLAFPSDPRLLRGQNVASLNIENLGSSASYFPSQKTKNLICLVCPGR